MFGPDGAAEDTACIAIVGEDIQTARQLRDRGISSVWGGSSLRDSHPWRTDIVERTGAKIIAVERGDDVLVEFAEAFQMAPDDALIVCGTQECLERFQWEFQSGTMPNRKAAVG